MARTPLLRLVRKAFRQAALSRREFLTLSAAAAAVAASPVRADAERLKTQRIAIIGGGAAGLTVAYRLAKEGIKPQLFEAGNRLGGRMFTRSNFNGDNMFCELGGEFVDTGHEDIRKLCAELGLKLQDLGKDESGKELYFFEGKYFTPDDLAGNKEKRGEISRLATRIAQDQLNLEKDNEWTDKAKELDGKTLHEYLESMKPLTSEWVIKLLDVAYTIEYGLPTSQQSALNLVLMLGTDLNKGFALYGESDEAWRIAGGSSTLTDALATEIKGKSELFLNHALVRLEQSTGAVACTFNTGMKSIRQSFDRVVLALPFTTLRYVDGLDRLKLTKEKRDSIRELGYGTNAKLMFGTTEKTWRHNAAFPVPSDGSFFTDLGIQCVWETSRGQQGEAGILTNYLGGAAGRQSQDVRIKKSREELEKLIPGIDKAWDKKAQTSFFWEKHPHTRGAYTCPKPGQVTGALAVAGKPELDGRLLFAGEHTSAEYNGFMNGAVESANRVVKELLAS